MVYSKKVTGRKTAKEATSDLGISRSKWYRQQEA